MCHVGLHINDLMQAGHKETVSTSMNKGAIILYERSSWYVQPVSLGEGAPSFRYLPIFQENPETLILRESSIYKCW